MQKSLLVVAALLLLAGWKLPRPPLIRVPRMHPRSSVVVPILEYHRVARRAGGLPGLTVAPATFASQMEWLHGAGYHAVSQTQLEYAFRLGLRLPPRPVLITFDDGYRDVLWNAAPLLHRLGMHATVYVIADRVGGRDPSFLDWSELRRLEALGFDVGSHTVHHVVLTALASPQAYEELLQSRLEIERRLRRPVRWLSYPLGAADDRVARLAAAAGYDLAVTEVPGSVQTAPLLLHRYEILRATGVTGVRAVVESTSG